MKVAMTLGLVAIVLFSLGLPALAADPQSSGQPGPTPPALGDPVAAQNAVQMVRLLGVAKGGDFTLELAGDTTAAIPYNFRAAGGCGGSGPCRDLSTYIVAGFDSPYDVQSVGTGYGTSQGAGLAGRSVQVTFEKVINGGVQVYPIPQMTVSASTLTGDRAVFGVLHGAINATQTTFDVDEIVLPPVMPFDILVDGEQMRVTGRAGGPGQFTYTVTRAQGGTTGVAHAVGAKVSSSNPNPFVVVETAMPGVGPVSDQVSPHGQFSSVTNYCLQCHAVHSYEDPDAPGTVVEPGEYALMMQASVTDTCNTCHKLFGNAGWVDDVTDSDAITGKPSIPGGMGTSSLRTAYDLGQGEYLADDPAAAVPGHQLGAAESPDGVVMDGGPGSASETLGGLYCASCHTPHGDFGQLINSVSFRTEAGTGNTNEVQRITLTNPTAGTFQLSWQAPSALAASTTAPIAYNATAAQIQAALEGLGTIDPGDVAVSDTAPALAAPAKGYDVQFTGRYAGVNVAAMEITGVTAVNEIQTVTISGSPTGGDFELDQPGSSAYIGPVAFDADAATFDAYLEQLSTIGVGGISVSGGPGPDTPWVVTFDGGSSAGKDVPSLYLVANNLTGGTSPDVAIDETLPGGSPAGTISTITAGGQFGSSLEDLIPWADGQRFFEGRSTLWFLHLDTARGVWQKCPDKTYTNCQDLTTVDMEGQTVYLYGYKLLSSKPNHTSVIESVGMGRGGHDGARWCGVCHTTKVSSEVSAASTYHSHPGTCTYCHGNPADGTSFDFPHTSTNGSLLKEYPDALCISCHTAGSLE